MQSCSVFFRNDSFYVVSQSFTTFGIAVSVGPMFKVATKVSRDVGEAVVAALNASRSDIPQPGNMAQVQKELCKFTGTRSWSDLAKTSAYVAVRCEGATVMVEPHKVAGGGAFVPDGAAISCTTSNVDDIGRSVLKALNLPESV